MCRLEEHMAKYLGMRIVKLHCPITGMIGCISVYIWDPSKRFDDPGGPLSQLPVSDSVPAALAKWTQSAVDSTSPRRRIDCCQMMRTRCLTVALGFIWPKGGPLELQLVR